MNLKTCASCKIEKDTIYFSKDSKRKDGLKPYCKECIKKQSKNYYENGGGKEKLKEKTNNEEFKKQRKEYLSNYRKTENGIIATEKGREKWLSSEKGREYNREYHKKYDQTEKRKEYLKQYEKTTRRENALKSQKEFQKQNTHKLCTGNYGCGKILPLSSFDKDKTTNTGYVFTCKECNYKYRSSDIFKDNLKNKQDNFLKTCDGKKKCTGLFSCGLEKPLEEFTRDFNSITTYNNACRSCCLRYTGSIEYAESLKQKQLKYLDNNNSKKCSNCNNIYPLDRFDKDKYKETGFHSICKNCTKLIRNERKNSYTEKSQLQYRLDNPQKFCKRCGQFYDRNFEFFDTNSSREDGLSDYCSECFRKISFKNRSLEKSKKRARDYVKNRKRTNIQFKLKGNVSTMIYQKLRRRLSSKETGSTFRDILPYTIDELMAHLESKFEPGMNWDNYGRKEGQWEIDHSVPESKYDYFSINDDGFKQCWSLENLQPMWSHENRSKNNRYEGKHRKKNEIIDI